MPKARYFFVNKDAASDNLGRSSGLQRSAIQKHVQRVVQKRQNSFQRQKQPAEKLLETDDKALYNPAIRSLSCKLDAFNGCSVHIDRTVRTLIDYYVYRYHPAIWNYQPIQVELQPDTLQQSATRNLRVALKDPLAMYCLLSAAASRSSNVDQISLPGASANLDIFMQEALGAMQVRIQGTDANDSGTTDPLVMPMMFLCSAEAYRHNYTAAWTHLKIALKILEPKGGVRMVQDKNLQGQLIMSDLALSCITVEPCLCPCEFYDPGPSSKLGLTEEEFSPASAKMGWKFFREGAENVPPDLRSLILAILDSYAAKNGLITEPSSLPHACETTYWVQKRNMAIRNKLLHFKSSKAKVLALRTALIMWTLLSMNITGRILTVKVMATKLQSTLSGISMQAWRSSNDGDIGLWILLVGHSCASEGSQTSAWFSEQIRRMLVLRSKVNGKWSDPHSLLEELVDFQTGFLYHDPTQRTRLGELAEWLSWWQNI